LFHLLLVFSFVDDIFSHTESYTTHISDIITITTNYIILTGRN